jgi:hypothetical protein
MQRNESALMAELKYPRMQRFGDLYNVDQLDEIAPRPGAAYYPASISHSWAYKWIGAHQSIFPSSLRGAT